MRGTCYDVCGCISWREVGRGCLLSHGPARVVMREFGGWGTGQSVAWLSAPNPKAFVSRKEKDY